ncbi:MAG: hypothetical protein J1F64_04520, partial [Oscillospiraceae bacterium]|nr:hypothetical protein [Oscillospiraceae bacterium]
NSIYPAPVKFGSADSSEFCDGTAQMPDRDCMNYGYYRNCGYDYGMIDKENFRIPDFSKQKLTEMSCVI